MASILFIGIVLLSSCKKKADEETPITDVAHQDYDAALLNLIEIASDGLGTAYFTLPASDNYAAIPQDPISPMTAAKVELGKLLFHETALGVENSLEEGQGTYSCASCHHSWGGFQACVQQGIGEGGIGFGINGEGRVFNPDYPLDSIDLQPLRTPSAMNGAFQPVTLWNGQFGANGPNKGTEHLWGMGSPVFNNQFGHDGLETQAIAGLTVHRMLVDEDVLASLPEYQAMFDAAFPEWPESTRYSRRTAGLAIGAYERTLMSNEAPFQDWLKGDNDAMTDNQKKGALLFFGQANCVACHTGPALNDMDFHALGMTDMETSATTYIGPDHTMANYGRASFTRNPEDKFKFKTPQLYNLKDSQFYGHGGNYTSVQEVIEYKNAAVKGNPNCTDEQLSEHFVPLNLTDEEIGQLVDFIENALYDPNLIRYVPDNLPSGNCIPNNDPISVYDQGCVQ